MTKTSKKRKPAAKKTPNRQKPRPASKTKPRVDAGSPARTKQALAITMLRSANGASIAALMKATDWQQHSVRGFLAGVVKRRLGLPLQSTKVDGSRVYRIADDGDIDQHLTTGQPTS